MSPHADVFEHLNPSWWHWFWNSWDLLRGGDIVEGRLGQAGGFEAQPHLLPSVCSLIDATPCSCYHFFLVTVSVTFFMAVIEHMTRSNLRESWCWLRFQGEGLIVVGRHGGGSKELRDHSELEVGWGHQSPHPEPSPGDTLPLARLCGLRFHNLAKQHSQ